MTELCSPATRMSRAIRDEITALVLARGLCSGGPLPTGTEPVETRGISRIARLRTR
ncbi:hypothetical protein FHS29_003887 [Saccharothrix tamanrassetensis]|uniref:Uncharacterized protein n=1 Tax=Saccharothrix tamanrassetensis TaxID=1051531 RepID=A0A841CLP7_9PSEU|nr:hypothetical protein [Saccharothrix tamanrassetensis]MBB5957294.1 hypothetical protein [Saccharothrix tamanrassetensis]